MQSSRHYYQRADSYISLPGNGNCEPSLRAFPSPERVSTLLTQITEFLSFGRQNVVSWHCLLGRLSSLCQLVPGDCLRMRSLHLLLRNRLYFVDESVVLRWTLEIELDLLWWFDACHLLADVSLVSPQPDLLRQTRVGGEPARPVCFGSLVGRGAELLQPVRAPGHAPQPFPF